MQSIEERLTTIQSNGGYSVERKIAVLTEMCRIQSRALEVLKKEFEMQESVIFSMEDLLLERTRNISTVEKEA